MYRNKKDWIFAILVLISLLFSLFTIYVYSENTPNISARSAALYEPETKSFIYTKNANERLGMASTTKIMSALIALESIELDAMIEVDDRAIGIDGSSIYLEQGEILSAEDLIYALMLSSANDAAEALAYEICGSIEGFCDMMNERARMIGLENTHFSNPHGLDAQEHYTTARELAIIASEALKNPKFKEISSTKSRKINSNIKTRVLVNHNKLLKMYEGCVGVKTGYTQMTGRSLVGAAERDGLCLISVTLDAPNDWTDHKVMLDYGFSTVHALTLIGEGEFNYTLPVINGTGNSVVVKNRNSLKYIYTDDAPRIVKEVRMPHFLVAPINKGDAVGSIVFKSDDEIIATTDIIATESVTKIKERIFDRLF